MTGKIKRKNKKQAAAPLVYPFKDITTEKLSILKQFFAEIDPDFQAINNELQSDDQDDYIHWAISTTPQEAKEIKEKLAQSKNQEYNALSESIVTDDEQSIIINKKLEEWIKKEPRHIHAILHNIGRYKHYLDHPGVGIVNTCNHNHTLQETETSHTLEEENDQNTSDTQNKNAHSRIDDFAEIFDAIGGGLGLMAILSRVASLLNQSNDTTIHNLLNPEWSRMGISPIGLISGAAFLIPIAYSDYLIHKLQKQNSEIIPNDLKNQLKTVEESLKNYLLIIEQITNDREISLALKVKQLKEKRPNISITLQGKQISLEEDQTYSFTEIENELSESTRKNINWNARNYALGHFFENTSLVMFTYADSYPVYIQVPFFALFISLGIAAAYIEYQNAYRISVYNLAFKEGKFINTNPFIPLLIMPDINKRPGYTEEKQPEAIVYYDKEKGVLKYKTTLDSKWQVLDKEHFSNEDSFNAIIDKAQNFQDLESNKIKTFNQEEQNDISIAIGKQKASLVSYTFLAILLQYPKVLSSFNYALQTLFYIAKNNDYTSISITSVAAFLSLISSYPPYFQSLRKENDANQQVIGGEMKDENISLLTSTKYLILASTLMYQLALACSRSSNVSYPLNQWLFSDNSLDKCMLSLGLLIIFTLTAKASASSAKEDLMRSPEVLESQNTVQRWLEEKNKGTPNYKLPTTRMLSFAHRNAQALSRENNSIEVYNPVGDRAEEKNSSDVRYESI